MKGNDIKKCDKCKEGYEQKCFSCRIKEREARVKRKNDKRRAFVKRFNRQFGTQRA
jgi:lysozyme family protein